MFVIVPSVVPFTTTDAPGMEVPSSAEVTVPEMSLVCANTTCNPMKTRNASNSEIFFIDINLLLKLKISVHTFKSQKTKSSSFF
jgi:hypothetical protein